MLQSALKLLCVAVGVLGPFGAGWIQHFIAHSEIGTFFMCAGVFAGLAGFFGFVSIERSEDRAHIRSRFGVEL